MTWTMTPALRAALREAIEGEGWDGDYKARLLVDLDATPDGPIDTAGYDAITESDHDTTDADVDWLNTHVVPSIDYFGLEHLATHG